MPDRLPLHQELMLLILRDREGTAAGSLYPIALGSACLAELTLQNRIAISEDKKQKVTLLDGTPLGDDVLDELLEKIAQSKRVRTAQDWIMKAMSFKKLKDRVAQPLCDRKIVRLHEKTILWVFTSNRYPEIDPDYERDLKKRMKRLMFGQTTDHDERTTILIALASQTDLLRYNFDRDRLKQHRDRIKRIANGELFAARATRNAVAAVQAAILVATIIPAVTAASHS